MACAPKRVKSFPRGSNYQTCGISECIDDLKREKAMLLAHLSELKFDIRLQNHASVISEKIKCEEKIEELSSTIGELQSELLASQREAAQAVLASQEKDTQPGSLRRGNSMCETKQEFDNAQRDLELALAAFEPFKICEEVHLQEHIQMDTSLPGQKQKSKNKGGNISGVEEPFNIHIMTSEQGKRQKKLFTMQ